MLISNANPSAWAHRCLDEDGIVRGNRSLNIERSGLFIHCHVRENHEYRTLYSRKISKKLLQFHPRKLSALNSDLGIKKPLSNDGTGCVYSTLDHSYSSTLEFGHSSKNTFLEQLNAFYRFSRPHTVIGTIVGITSVSLLPIQTMSDLNFTFFIGLLKALLPAILMNIYVVGLNQLYDVEIDKVNKPDLPLASGDFSMEFGATIVATFSSLSFAMGILFQSPPLLYALLISFLLGSAYSVDLPYLRWKKHAVLAATCILSVRALVVQLAFFLHTQRYVLGQPIAFPRSLVFATAFMCFFSAVIALFKDIPDVDGDRNFGIESFSVRLGKKRVFWLCINMLLMAYGAAVVIGASSPNPISKLITVLGHGMLASILLLRARYIDLTNKESVTSFYMFIWNLFYAEYFLIPFVR